ncbi:MHS family MFS transporter [Azospirillum sp. YIM B02556]|uniref:MHS family MFS transporter n=1 Tax=Azospirillum endophyticum TaxID=2800326 RepID=A0ABS1F5J5_9PROT|nr:MFS transporter [Azospirillum endophyticum]MBK1838701.1 MHS family MFS transporter [Azospirillum endophyticum]
MSQKAFDGRIDLAEPPAHAVVEDADCGLVKRVAFASAIGNAIEYYDFTLYATATALVFNKIFFPSSDPLVGSLAAFATFFVGYCARPIGGMLFGHFGDRVGRKAMLLITIMMMGLGTVLIGLMPSYDQIGVFAPIGLLVLRIVQGIGLGGEYGGGMVMTVEHAAPEKRGYYSALVHIGVPAGFLIPIVLLSIMSAAMTEEVFLSWGWRLPFLFSIVLVGVGVFIRRRISETPAFAKMLKEEKPARLPLVEAVTGHWRDILLGIGAKIAESGLFNVYAVVAITYCMTTLGLPKQTILNGVLLGCALECVTLPFFGALSDRIGRKAVYVIGMGFQAVLALVFFPMLDTGNTGMIWLAIALGLAIGHGSVYGAQGAFFSELFPARIRYSGLSLVQQLGPILGGGLSPLVATAILAGYGTTTLVTAYMVGMALLSGLSALALKPRHA